MEIKLKKEVFKIVGYDTGAIELYVNGQKRKVSEIKFEARVGEPTTLKTTEVL